MPYLWSLREIVWKKHNKISIKQPSNKPWWLLIYDIFLYLFTFFSCRSFLQQRMVLICWLTLFDRRFFSPKLIFAEVLDCVFAINDLFQTNESWSWGLDLCWKRIPAWMFPVNVKQFLWNKNSAKIMSSSYFYVASSAFSLLPLFSLFLSFLLHYSVCLILDLFFQKH